MGWSRGFVFLGFTVALLTMGIVSSAVGRAIDRHGARVVMTLGTVLVSAGLFALAHARSGATYLAVWVFLGLGMRLCLYDAAFAALVQVAPSRGRMAISYLTLFGAFASSVFWLIGHALNERVGWRQTLVLFALINLAVCLPLHWLGLARRETIEGASPPTGAATSRMGRRWKGVRGPSPSRSSLSSCHSTASCSVSSPCSSSRYWRRRAWRRRRRFGSRR